MMIKPRDSPVDDATRSLFQAFVLSRYGSVDRPSRLVVDFDDAGVPIAEHLEVVPLAQAEPCLAAPAPKSRTPAHTPDFASVFDGERSFVFTSIQRSIVAVLWEMREQGTPCVSRELLLDVCGTDQGKMSEVFRRSPAWGTLIVPGESGGTYKLRFAGDQDKHAGDAGPSASDS